MKVCLLFIAAFVSMAALGQVPPVRVACLGNSVTYGYLLAHPETESYPARLQQMLGDRYAVRNFGHSGATLLRKGHNPYDKTPEFLHALAYSPDIAIIDLGLNDTDPRDWPDHRDEFAPDYSWLIDTLRAINPSMKIYVCLLTPIFNGHPRFKSGTRDWFREIQGLIPGIAAANQTACIDLHTPLYDRPGLFPDALHPNAEGAGILARTVYGGITGDYGALKMPEVFADHMVLQRGRPIPVYGTGDAGATIRVTLRRSGSGGEQAVQRRTRSAATGALDITGVTRAAADGKWTISLRALPAGGPYQLTVEGEGRNLVFRDVLIGDVWLCAGQSNMDFPLSRETHAASELSSGVDSLPGLRLYQLHSLAPTDNDAWDSATLAGTNSLAFFSGRWQTCDSASASTFSAVAYYFGKRLALAEKVPIGLIQVSVGGSPLASWLPRDTMEEDPVLVDFLSNWRHSDFLMQWCRDRAAVNLAGSAFPLQRHPFDPCYDYEAGVSRLVQTPIKGVIWYQGESDAFHPELFGYMFPAMVASWRHAWGYDFPFYYVQLSGVNRPDWPLFRDTQRRLLAKVPDAGMAVTSDLGDPVNVHYPEKRAVGERLARLALHGTYHRNIAPCGPWPLKAVRKATGGDEVIFGGTSALATSDGKALRGFEWVNEKGFHIAAKATIENNKVIITLPGQVKATNILYAWKPYPDANLVGADGLPVSTFRLQIQQGLKK